MNILVLGGGDSPEREVSLRSARAVAAAARQAGFSVTEADPASGWEILNEVSGGTIVFPILHGAGGEDGAVQQELEKRGLDYLGSDSRSSAACFDKAVTRAQLARAGIPIAEGDSVTRETYGKHRLAGRPHVLKVARGGSSIGTLLATDPARLDPSAIKQIFELDSEAIIEQLIIGTEITVPVLDATALPVIEIVPPPNEEFDYKNKYNGRTQELCPPHSVVQELQRKAQALAEEVHSTMACRHLSRVDIMIDNSGHLYVLEINTMPGMTDQSLYPRSAAVAGLPMPSLMKRFADMVRRDGRSTTG